MVTSLPPGVFDLPHLREKTRVFSDRAQAGEILADVLDAAPSSPDLVLGIPAGGLPVAAVIHRRLGLDLDVAVVSKITLPWNTEAGYGAVAFDGTVRLNQAMLAHIGLSPQQIKEGIEKTRRKVRRRVRRLRGGRPWPDLTRRAVILVDDGIASGFTLRVAVEAIRKAGAGSITVAVPTGHRASLPPIASAVSAVYCPNIRGGMRFAVADAYANWSDVTAEELDALLAKSGQPLRQ
ncbi:MAG: phosphoribosyltransferase [Desulfobacterales bacterium]|nr:MAG: phosphoribosyltransferase [Desulfobacterales bacterium]